MAKRRRLETPSTTDLARLESEFRSETSPRRPAAGAGLAPISQVAAETAALSDPGDAETRAARARTEAEAARLADAEARGLLIAEIPIEAIDEASMVRDRMVLSEEGMVELRLSIAANGLRLPIEVYEIAEAGQGPRYGLLSGYRRLQAVRTLRDMSGAAKYDRIRALIRPAAEADAAFVAMVEENEVRAELSHFERGRIAVIAAQQGAFANTEDAVNRLYATASKAKRSKVRSFALIFEELGDMLAFPEALTERRGLRLAGALRDGAERALRRALSEARPEDGEAEWAEIEAALDVAAPAPRAAGRGGRPKRAMRTGWLDDTTIRTSSGITIQRAREGEAHILRLEGRALSHDLMEMLMVHIQGVLER